MYQNSNTENNSDDALDGWCRERLLPEAHADVESRSVVAGSPAVGLRTAAEAMPPTAEPAGAGRCVRRCFDLVGGVTSGCESTCADSTVEIEESESLPSSSPARSDACRSWKRRSTSTSFFPTWERCPWARRKRNVSQFRARRFSLVVMAAVKAMTGVLPPWSPRLNTIQTCNHIDNSLG